MKAQAVHFGAEIVYDTVQEVELEGKTKTIKGLNNTYQAKAVILANGAQPATLGCPGEKNLQVGAYPIAPPATALSSKNWRYSW